MTKNLKKLLFTIPITVIILGVLFCVLFYQRERGTDTEDIEISLTANESLDKKIELIKDGATDYSIVFSTNLGVEASLSSQLRSLFYKLGVNISIDYVNNVPNHTSKEILIGETDRHESKAFMSELNAAKKNSDDLVWGYAVKNGKLLYLATNSIAFKLGEEAFKSAIVNSDFSLDADLKVICIKTMAEYEAEIEAEKEEERKKRIEELKNAIAGFENSDFTGDEDMDVELTVMPGTNWGQPHLYPAVGEHPRVNISSKSLEYIKEYVETTDEGKYLYKAILNLANREYSGILEDPYYHETGRRGFHNVDETGLAIIEARAFAYLVSGDAEYGYSAILAMKNYLDTFYLGYIYSDQCREFGRTMFVTAEIYDWCYDLLTEKDKTQFILACTYIASGDAGERYGGEYSGLCSSGNEYMEVGYPPIFQESVAGHGAEAQILRDYLAISIAIFDENDSWYKGVASRLYNDFIPFRDYYFESGMYPQGIFNYAPHRHSSDLWSAWLFYCATGENPYSPDLQRVANSFLDFATPDGSFFGTGDGAKRPTGVTADILYNITICAALYGDPGLRSATLDYYNGSLVGSKTSTNTEFSTVHHIIFGAGYFEKTGSTDTIGVNEGKDVIVYHSTPIGQMIARSKWNDPDAPAVFMLVGEKSTSNHEHADSGTFQLFYKGLYLGESGVYDKYGSTHWKYYHQATVSHNGILIYDPKLAGNDPDMLSTYFYSGGQRQGFECGSTLEDWLGNSDTNKASVMGYEYALNADGSADYAYLAGDITLAYTPAQASYVSRNMIAIFTDNPDCPMYFVVYDSLDVAESEFVTKFLLHTPTEPVIDEESKTVTISGNEGKLVLHSLNGTDKIEALGGANRNYLINGVQCSATNGSDGMWGRVELSSTGKEKVDMFNVMYFTDAENEESQSFELFDEDSFIATKVGSDYVIFSKSQDRTADPISITTEGTGLSRYIVMGLHEGTWDIEVDGISVAHRVATEEGGMIVFYAPSGEVSIKPGNDIPPSNGGRIIYYGYGGIIPDDAPVTYTVGVPFTLPENIRRGNDLFLGWYTSPTFENNTRVTGEIYPKEKGRLTFYAKYNTVALLEDFENRDFSFSQLSREYGDLKYEGQSKTGSKFEILTNELTGNKYLCVTGGTRDPQINMTKEPSSYVNAVDTKITFELDLARNGDNRALESSFMLREETTSQRVILFSTTSRGNVVFGGATLFTLTSKFTKLIITVDFENGTMTAFNKQGDVLATTTWSVPVGSTATNTYTWLNKLKYTFNWWFGDYGSGHSMLIDNLKIYCDAFDSSQYQLPAGTNIIDYKTGAAVISGDYPETYTVGKTAKLPDAIIPGGEFYGWYTTPTFEKDTEIKEINATNADHPIVVYAKCKYTAYENNFTDSKIDIDPTYNTTVSENKIDFECGKAGSWAKALTDAYGNVYMTVTTDGNDASINNLVDISSAAINGGGKITYELDLAKLPSGINGRTTFSIRGKDGPSDTINLFVVLGNGNVILNNNTDIIVAPINRDFTKFIFTLDIYEETLTAYDEYGYELASTDVKVPNKTEALYDNVADWFFASMYAFNWHIDVEGGIAFDNIKIYSGEYETDAIIPGNSNRVFYHTGNGTLGTNIELFYVAGTPLILPIPTPANENEIFCGWYTTSNFDSASLIKEINADNSDAAIHIYAKYALPEDMNRIEYVVGLGELNPDSPKFYIAGSTVILLDPTPIGENEEFAGWYMDADFSGEALKSITIDNADKVIKLYAKYKLRDNVNRIEYEIGNATLSSNSPKFYIVGQTIILPTPKHNGLYEEFDGWYTNSEFTGVAITEIKAESAGEVIRLYAKWKLPEGINSIDYWLGDAKLPDGAPMYYSVGEIVTLPIPILTHSKYNTVFKGWYRTADFTGEPVAEINEVVADAPVKLYALFNMILVDADFTDTDAKIEGGNGVVAPDDKSFDGVYYQFKNKYAGLQTMTDAAGNVYVRVKTDKGDRACDPLIYITGTAYRELVINNGGKVTYELDMAVPKDGKCANTTFRVRAGKAADNITIFQTNTKKQVLLNANPELVVATLDEQLTKLIFTLDIVNETVTAYNEYGETIATTKVTVPAAAAEPKPTSVLEWYQRTEAVFQWYYEAGVDIIHDNLKVYTGVCKDYVRLPENSNKIIFKTGDGAIAGEAPKYYTANTDLMLPEPLLPASRIEEFVGWYRTQDFSGERIAVLNETEANEPITLYAKYALPEGVGKIEYNLNDGVIPDDSPMYYRVGEKIAIPEATRDGYAFAGWYTSSTFNKDSIVTEINVTTADEHIVLYARFIKQTSIFEQSFEGSELASDSDATYSTSADKKIDGITYGFSSKTASVSLKETSDGNKYIELYTGDASSGCDPTIISENRTFKAQTFADGGKITWELDLATHADGRINSSTFRLRETTTGNTAKDVIVIFQIDSKGKVLLGGNSDKVVGALNTSLTKYIFTLDIYDATLSAYSVQGDVITTIDVSVPTTTKTGATTVAEWYESVGQYIQWYFSGQGGIAFDNIKVHTGDYTVSAQ